MEAFSKCGKKHSLQVSQFIKIFLPFVDFWIDIIVYILEFWNVDVKLNEWVTGL